MLDRIGVLPSLTALIAAFGLASCTTFTITVPVPNITSLSPSAVTAGSPAFDLTINGSGFGRVFTEVRFGSVVYTDTQWVSVTPTALVIRVGASTIATAGQLQVTVNNRPGTYGGGTAVATFTINNVVPSVASVVTNLPPPDDRNTAPAGGPAFRMMVTGSGFVAGSLVQWDGIARITNLVSPNQVTTDVPASDAALAKVVQVSVFNPPPGGGRSQSSLPFSFYPTLTVIPFVGLVPWFQTRVTFDNPPPPTSNTPLNGLYPRPPSTLAPRLNFPTGQWEWVTEIVNNVRVNDVFFSVSAAFPANSRSFSFANGPRILSSVEVITLTAGTLTLRDDNGRTRTQQIPVGPVQTVVTGWFDQPSAAITVDFTAGREIGITAVSYLGLP